MMTPTRMPKSWKRPKRTKSKLPSSPPERIRAEREALLLRLAQLHESVKDQRGYRTAITLLSKRFLVATQATQIALLQAATFMVDVLERLPPPT
jgi:hypothetical protein